MAEIRHKLRDKADERIALFRESIEDFVPCGFSIMVPPDAIKRVYGSKDRLSKHPIYCAFYILAPLLAESIEKYGLSPNTIELILDDEKSEKGHIMDAWDFAKKNAKVQSPELQSLLSGTPLFRNDKKMLPLQAANLLAWWIRRSYFEKMTGTTALEMPEKRKETSYT